jgi:hypothetical protein
MENPYPRQLLVSLKYGFNMSFGWSAGYIAQAIIVLIKLVQTLDDANGAASGYREAVSFLTSLKRTS